MPSLLLFIVLLCANSSAVTILLVSEFSIKDFVEKYENKRANKSVLGWSSKNSHLLQFCSFSGHLEDWESLTKLESFLNWLQFQSFPFS